VAALGLKVPPPPEGQPEPRAGCRCFARRPVILAGLVTLLFAVFMAAIIMGLRLPIMSLNVDINRFFKPNGPLALSMKPIIEGLHIARLAHAEVSLWHCMLTLATWTGNGEANAFIAFVLFTVLVVATTCLNMLLLLATSLAVWVRPNSTNAASKMLRVIKVIKKLSFLDVAVVGIVVVVVAGESYSERGIILRMQVGLLLLFLAELCHYAAYFCVEYAVLRRIQVREATLTDIKKQTALPAESGDSKPPQAAANESPRESAGEQVVVVMDLEAR